KEYAEQGGPGTEIADAIPSLDMRPVLALFSPEDAYLRMEGCSKCGGRLEIVTRETKRVANLTKKINGLTAQLGASNKTAGELRAELQIIRQRVGEQDDRNAQNRDVLVTQMERIQRAAEAEVEEAKRAAEDDNRAWKAKLEKKDKELEVVPVLESELSIARENLARQEREREEEIFLQDRDITVLQNKIEQQQEVAEKTATLVEENKAKIVEVEDALENEKREHQLTVSLLEDEKARYQRCRTNLEKAQGHLADLEKSYNELLEEAGGAAEDAQSEVGEAQEELEAIKAENRRMRMVLANNDAASALDAVSQKVLRLKSLYLG
ncbi:unnamed protein product, partial [Discosporangium mesarthrocarpum]